MAHKKGVGSSRNGRDSNGQRLGVKAYGGQTVHAGSILVRQRGTKIHPGINVLRGKDDTLFATKTGKVLYHRLGKDRKQVSIVVENAVVENAVLENAVLENAVVENMLVAESAESAN